jgi:hypothetical protein
MIFGDGLFFFYNNSLFYGIDGILLLIVVCDLIGNLGFLLNEIEGNVN